MAKHVIGIRNDGREFRNKLNALPHQIIAGSVICIDVYKRQNYGEGSSREHAAMEPRFLNVRVILGD